MRCSNCGNELTEGARVCPRCGTRQNLTNNEKSVGSGASKKSLGAVFGLVATILLVFIIGILYVKKSVYINRNANKVLLTDEDQINAVNKIIDEYNRANPDNVIKNISSNDYNNNNSNDNKPDINTLNNNVEISCYETKKENIVKDEKTGVVYVNNELLVLLKEGVSRDQLEEVLNKLGWAVVGQDSSVGKYQIQLNKNYSYKELKSVQRELKNSDIIDDIVLNIGIDVQEEYEYPKDKEWANEWDDYKYKNIAGGKNWGMEAINIPKMWQIMEKINASEKTNVGIYDGQFDVKHKDININVEKSAKLISSHGTHVAGIIGAKKNNIGVVGVAKDAKMFGVTSDSINGLELISKLQYVFSFLINKCNCKVISTSMALKVEDETEYIEQKNNLTKVLKKILSGNVLIGKRDFVIIRSAGNSCQDCIYYQHNKGSADDDKPYGYSLLDGIDDKDIKGRIIIVGAAKLDNNNLYVAEFSNYGNRVDLIAPGYNIYSCVSNNGYDMMNGTSMAAPHVAGVASNLFSANRYLTGNVVKYLIVNTAQGKYKYNTVRNWGKEAYKYSYGMLDGYEAIKKLTGIDIDNLEIMDVGQVGSVITNLGDAGDDYRIMEKNETTGLALLVAEKGVDCVPYVKEGKLGMTMNWNNSSIKKYLEEEYINRLESKVKNSIVDITILSKKELEKYYGADIVRQLKPSDKAIKNGAYVCEQDDKEKNFVKGNTIYWIKDTVSNTHAMVVNSSGVINKDEGAPKSRGDICVRPAMWVRYKEVKKSSFIDNILSVLD